MALIVADRVQETSTTTGVGAFTLLGATTGYRAASTVCANGSTFTYYAEDIDVSGRPIGDWETGLGTWGTGNILTRTTIYASSNANAAVNWAAGTRRIGLSLVSQASLGPTTIGGSVTTNATGYGTLASFKYTNGFSNPYFNFNIEGDGQLSMVIGPSTSMYYIKLGASTIANYSTGGVNYYAGLTVPNFTVITAGGIRIFGPGNASNVTLNNDNTNFTIDKDTKITGNFQATTGINSTVIGGTTPAAGSFTTLNASELIRSQGVTAPSGAAGIGFESGASSGIQAFAQSYNRTTGAYSVFRLMGSTVNIGPDASTTVATIASTGLAVTGALSATGITTITATYPELHFAPSGWASFAWLQAGVNSIATGVGDYLTSSVPTGKGFSWSINYAEKMSLSSTGLAVTGDVTASGFTSSTNSSFTSAGTTLTLNRTGGADFSLQLNKAGVPGSLVGTTGADTFVVGKGSDGSTMFSASSTGLSVIGGISTNQSIAVTNTIDYATLSLTGQLLSWISLSVPGNDSYWLRNGSGGVFRIENATQSTSPFEIINPGTKKLVINGSGATITGDVSTGSTAADAYFKLTEATVLKASFRWDYGNGAAWIGTDVTADMVIKYNGAEKARILSSGMSVSGTASATSNTVSAVSSSGYGFWGTGPIAYGILMSGSADTTYGGRIAGETTSDYNMYFTMTQGTNRGFVFRNAYATPLFAINGDGVRSNVGITITGALTATSKSFLIPHPLKEGKKLRYGSLEGPEHGVYCRGRLKGNTIELPDYWAALVDPDSITVQLTPVGQHQKLYVKDISNNQVIIGNENLFGSIDCFYIVNAERRDIASLIVEE